MPKGKKVELSKTKYNSVVKALKAGESRAKVAEAQGLPSSQVGKISVHAGLAPKAQAVVKAADTDTVNGWLQNARNRSRKKS